MSIGLDFAMHRRAQDCLAHGASVAARHPDRFVLGAYPTHVKRGQGCWLWDHKGNKYLDFMGGQGTSILGYAPAQVTSALGEQVGFGTTYSLSSHHEIETAEKVKELFPFIDCVKFVKGADDALALANRVAGLASRVPIVITPASHIGSLDKIRDDATKAQRLLVFDETRSCLRFPKFSVSGYTGVIPDLIVLGGAIANGMDLAVVGGKFAVMNHVDVPDSPFVGETLALVAARVTMTLLQTKHDLAWLWGHGQKFLDEFNDVYPDRIRIEGFPTYGVFAGDPAVIRRFWELAAGAGMLFGPTCHFTFPLADEYKNALGAIKAILGKIKTGEMARRSDVSDPQMGELVWPTRN